MNIETLETILIFFIVIIQISLFFRTRRQIRIFKNIIPEISSIEISRIFVPDTEVENRPLREILLNSSNYKIIHDTENGEKSKTSEISIIESSKNENAVFGKILYSINTYLIKNRNAASDFNLIKDITERNADAVEEDINLTISIPLYLGLMGTMLGIVIGLFSMSSLSLTNPGEASLGQGITILLGGVKIAMIASFTGLFLTTLNSGVFYKGSKSIVEEKKNEFYTFIQTELLPVINQSMEATFQSLQRNLFKFNGEFTGNLGRLSGIFENNFKTLELQESVLSKIEKIDIATVAKYNVNVLKELQTSMDSFEKFNDYVANINSSINISANLVEKLTSVLNRTENFREIAENIDNKLAQSQMLLDFLSAHFNNLEEYKQKTTVSIAETGFQLSDVFKDLREHIGKSSQEVKEFTVQEVDLLKQALSESKTNLGNLQFLEKINREVSQLKDSTASQSERIRKLLTDVNKNLETSINRIEYLGISLKRKSLTTQIKQLFGQNGE